MTETTTEPLAPAQVRTALLHRPAIPTGAVERPDLLTALDHGLERSLTLVTAPAGFGKTILVSQWCEVLDRPAAWLSLDESVADRQRFVPHLVAAVRSVVPDALEELVPAIEAGRLPDGDTATVELSNGLDEIEEPILVVLDDFHLVGSTEVHRLVSGLLTHPPEAVHFVITSRYDPPLPLAALRAGGQITELRMADLSFTEQQLSGFVEAELGRPVAPERLRALYETTEGWPAGVRLAVEAVRFSGEHDEVLGAGFLDRGMQEYLTGEVLHHVPHQVRRYLVAASHFDRFSARLCEAAMEEIEVPPTMMSGQEFIDWLQRYSLFVVPLDDDGRWFRFHRVFAHLLEIWRKAQGDDLGMDERELHRTAARVLQADGHLEEAIEQLHLAGEADRAAVLTVEHGNQLIDEERWGELGVFLSTVPSEVSESDPRLLVLRAWLVGDYGGRHREMNELLTRAESILDQSETDQEPQQELRGQITVLRGTYSKLNAGDIDGAVLDAEKARRLMSSSPGRHLAYAYALGAVALANGGKYEAAHRLADAVGGDERFDASSFDPMLWMRPFLAWIEGDLADLDRWGTQMLKAGERLGHRATIGTGHYFLGTSAYERNDLTAAEEHLSITVDTRFMTLELSLHSAVALALTEWAQGRGSDAAQTADSMMREALDARGDYYLPTAQAFVALLDLRRGRKASALRWARAADPDVPRHRYMFFDQAPALIEICLSSQTDVGRGGELLDRMLRSKYGRFNRPVNTKLLGLEALRQARAGDAASALDALEHAVRRSHEGGMIRSLADLGDELTPLLQRLDVSGPVLGHVGAILEAMTTPAAPDREPRTTIEVASSVPGSPALTEREMDVLRLLAHRYTNREIAAELYIAPGTVKKRTVSLYDKLNVHGRREAVVKARALGYIKDRTSPDPTSA